MWASVDSVFDLLLFVCFISTFHFKFNHGHTLWGKEIHAPVVFAL